MCRKIATVSGMVFNASGMDSLKCEICCSKLVFLPVAGYCMEWNGGLSRRSELIFRMASMNRKTWRCPFPATVGALHRSAWCHVFLLATVLLLASAELFHSAMHHHCRPESAAAAQPLQMRWAMSGDGHAEIQSAGHGVAGSFSNASCPLCNGAFLCTGYIPSEIVLTAPRGQCRFPEPEKNQILKLPIPCGRAPPPRLKTQ